jgi:hypothetical protein
MGLLQTGLHLDAFMNLFADKPRTLQYGIIPLGLGLICVVAYFSGIESLQSLVSPKINREFGLLENAQNALLLAGVVFCVRVARRETTTTWRGLLYLAALACLVVLAEEIDWGDHYWSALTGVERAKGETFNLHNQGDINTWLKRAVDLGCVIFFVILPLTKKLFVARFRIFLPNPYSALTLLAGVIVSSIAHELEDAGFQNNGSLHKNISEFRELFTYTVSVLYLWEVTKRRSDLLDEVIS